MAQTYTDFEVLVVDNGSTDQTCVVVAAIDEPRVHYHFQENTGGPAGPRNLGIRNATGRYVAFLDSDDVWLPHALETLMRPLERDASVGMAYGQNLSFGSNASAAIPWPDVKEARSGSIFKELFVSDNFIPCLAVLVRKSAIDEVGGFDEHPALKSVEDFDLWLRISQEYPVKFIPKVIGRHRIHNDQLTSHGIEKVYTHCLNITAKFKNNDGIRSYLVVKRTIRCFVYNLLTAARNRELKQVPRIVLLTLQMAMSRCYLNGDSFSSFDRNDGLS